MHDHCTSRSGYARSTKIIPGSGEDYRIHKSRNSTRENGAGGLWGVHIIPGANPGYTVHLFCRYIQYFVVELNSFNLKCLFNRTQIRRRMNYLRCFGFGGNLRPELCTYLLLDPKPSYPEKMNKSYMWTTRNLRGKRI